MPPLLLLALFFVLVMGAVLAAGAAFLHRRQQALAGGPTAQDDAPAASWREPVARLGELLPKRSSHVQRYRLLLAHAGYHRPDSLTLYFGIKAASMLGAAVTLTLLSLINSGDSAGVLLAVCAGIGIGHLLPDRLLGALRKRRTANLRRALPLAVELLILSLEAGQSLDSAIADSAVELAHSYPDLAEEFNLVMAEMIAGRSRVEALQNFIARCPELDCRRIAQVLIDGDRFGAGVAGSLRNQLRFLRTRTRQIAQEQARKVSVKLVFPIFFLIFPAILLVTLGPALLRVFGALEKMTGGLAP
jgi:tight adherence protein C